MSFQVSLFSIILILAFYLPGYSFRRCYFSSFSTKQFGHGEWYDRFFISVFIGIVIQYVSIKILRDNFHFNFDSVSSPLSQVNEKLLDNKFPDIDFLNLKNAIAYLSVLLAFAGILGLIFRNIVIFFGWDIKFSVLRFANPWQYYFRGRILRTRDFMKVSKNAGKRVATRADVLMDFEVAGRKALYSGVLSQYDLSVKGDKLERVYLTSAIRFKSNEDGFKSIPGDIFMIEANKILNINLSYDYSEKLKKTNALFPYLYTLAIIVFFSPVFLIPFYLYSKIGIWRTIAGIILFFVCAILFYMIIDIAALSKENFKEKYATTEKAGTVGILGFAFVIFLLLTLFTIF